MCEFYNYNFVCTWTVQNLEALRCILQFCCDSGVQNARFLVAEPVRSNDLVRSNDPVRSNDLGRNDDPVRSDGPVRNDAPQVDDHNTKVSPLNTGISSLTTKPC